MLLSTKNNQEHDQEQKGVDHDGQSVLVVDGVPVSDPAEDMITGQEELAYIWELQKKVDEQKLYIDELRSALSGVTGISYDKESVQTSVQSDTMGDKFAKIEIAEKKLKELEHSLLNYKVWCIDRIHMMRIGNHQKLLYLVYIDGLTLKQTAERMFWSYEYTKKVHRKALKEYEGIRPLHVP